MKESISLTLDLYFFYYTSYLGFFNNGEIKRGTVSHFYRSVDKICFEELDWTTPGELHWQPFLAGWLFASFSDHLAGSFLGFLQMLRTLCLVLVLAEIFDAHLIVLLATSKTKMKPEQIPQSVKE